MLALVVIMVASLCTVTAYSYDAILTETENSIETNPEEAQKTFAFNWDQYSLDELLQIQKELNEKVLEKQRQYAIENGNRKITLSEDEFTVFTRKSITLVPTIERVIEDAPQRTYLVWTSSNNKVATVSGNGTVTGVAKGDAIITCTAKDDEYIFKTAVVHVVLPVTSVTVSEKEITLLIDEKKPDSGKATLSYAIAPEDAFVQDVTWKSDKEGVAVVDQNGNVTAVAPGRAFITAYSNEAGSTRKGSCTVTVLQAVAAIDLDNTDLSINYGTSKQIKATVMPQNASKKTVRWTSSDESVARVSANGTVSGVGCGEAVITCSAEDGSGTLAECKIHVIQMVKSVKIKDYSGKADFQFGEKVKLFALVEPENATSKTVSWESSDPGVVKIDRKGLLEVIGAGTATITCKATDGSGVQAQLSVYVPSISIDKQSYTVSSKNGITIPIKFYGKKENFQYTISPSGIVKDSISWADDNKTVKIALTAKAAGTITISLEDKSDSRSSKKITVVIPSQYVPNVTDTSEWERWVDSQFSIWNGKHIQLEKMIKERLNDEKSYKHKKTTYIAITDDSKRDSVNSALRDVGSSYRVSIGDLFIQTEFTAKNAFNATIKNTAYGIAQYATEKIILIRIE